MHFGPESLRGRESVPRKIIIVNAYGRLFTAMPSFAASCEGRMFKNVKGCRAARCDGVKMWIFLFRFLLNSVQESCSYHAPLFSVPAWRPTRRNLAGDCLMQFSATVRYKIFTAQL